MSQKPEFVAQTKAYVREEDTPSIAIDRIRGVWEWASAKGYFFAQSTLKQGTARRASDVGESETEVDNAK